MKPKKVAKSIPTFASEAQEAEWWYRNRKILDRSFVKAARSGGLKVLDHKTLTKRIARSKAKVVSIRLPEADLAQARMQAERKGLPYQTYIKSLLHQALESQSKAR